MNNNSNFSNNNSNNNGGARSVISFYNYCSRSITICYGNTLVTRRETKLFSVANQKHLIAISLVVVILYLIEVLILLVLCLSINTLRRVIVIVLRGILILKIYLELIKLILLLLVVIILKKKFLMVVVRWLFFIWNNICIV